MGKIKIENQELFKKKDKMTIIILFVFVLEFIALIYSNITQMKFHIGYDASYFYNKAIEIWNQKSLVLDNWSDQTALNFDTSILFASVLYGITKEIFLSYGIANIINDVFLVVTVYFIAKEYNLEYKYRCLACCLLIAPFITSEFSNANDLGYYSMLLGNCQAYAGRTILDLLIILIILKSESVNFKVNKLLLGISFVLSFVCGISSGVYVIMVIILPIFAFYIIKTCLEKEKKNHISKFFFLFCNAAFIVLGTIVQSKIFMFQSRSASVSLVNVKDFWGNLGSIWLGFLQLIGAYPQSEIIMVTSIKAIPYLCAIALLFLIVIATVVTLKKHHGVMDIFILPLFVVAINILMFSVGAFTYGSPIFESRYLILDYILLALSLCIYIHECDNNRLWKTLITIICTTCIGVESIFSYKYYISQKINIEKYDFVLSSIKEINAPVAFVSSNLNIEGRNWDVFLDDKNIKVFQMDENGISLSQVLWGASTSFAENAEWEGENLLICQKEEFDLYPQYIKSSYKYIGEYEDINLYYSDSNVLDFNSNVNGNKVNLYPYSPGMILQYGSFSPDMRTYISDGTEGYVMLGPYGNWEAGEYKVTLQYSMKGASENFAGNFELVTECGETVWAATNLLADQSQISFNVTLEQDLTKYELRCFEKNGTILEIKKICIERID